MLYLCNRDFDDPAFLIAGQFLGCFNIFAYGDLYVGEGLFFGGSLRPAAGQAGAGNTVTFLGLAENNAITCHRDMVHPASIRR